MILNYSNANLDFGNAKFIDINDDKNKYTSITIPVIGDKYSLLSNVTLVFDSNTIVVKVVDNYGAKASKTIT
ncbi:hypothetical protein H131_13058 [Lysinibacillus sphaericus OT4b.31]|uniref:Uncharacterized protein n=1 Tax=Lysinibacillus sphaericus OT4b.31 TaxID=1285586 RepID=R7ZCX3_LYSSH|nr:hypothetical protein H131_13058 [Lysinibacillus sphaericus OT4b.31]